MKMKNLLKYGKTFRSIKNRFSGKRSLPYSYEILQTYIFKNAIDCSSFEKQLHDKFENYKHSPLIFFHGTTECYDSKILELNINV